VRPPAGLAFPMVSGHRPRAARHAETSPQVVRRRTDAWVGVCGLILFAVCATAASSGEVGPLERAVFEAVNGLPRTLLGPMQVVQFLGVLGIGPIVALAALAARRPRLASAVATATLAKLVAERIVWEILIRERPGTTIPGAIVASGVPTSGPAFVSGHVVLSAAIAMILSRWLPSRWRWAPWLATAGVALARPYLGAHAPLDVAGGLGLGLAIGGSVNLAFGVPSRAGGSAADPRADD